MTDNLKNLIKLANDYGTSYDNGIVVVSEEPLTIVMSDEDEEEVGYRYEFREEPPYQGMLMFSLTPVGEDAERDGVNKLVQYFSGSGTALFALMYA